MIAEYYMVKVATRYVMAYNSVQGDLKRRREQVAAKSEVVAMNNYRKSNV